MKRKRRFYSRTVASGAVLALILGACQGFDDSSSGPGTTSAIELNRVMSAAGCLSVPSYFEAIQALSTDLPILEISTKLSMSSKHAIRDGFRRSLAYATFAFREARWNDLRDFE